MGMGPVKITRIAGKQCLTHSFKDVKSVHSDGQTLWVESLDPQKLVHIPFKDVRSIVGTTVARDTL